MNKIFVIGQPNSGKTTLCKDLEKILPDSILIETDYIQVKLIESGVFPKWKKYNEKLGQLLHELTEEQKAILKNSIIKEINSAENHNVIIEGYALTLPEYYSIITDDAIVVNKQSITEDCIPAILRSIHDKGMSYIQENMPRFYQRFNFTEGHSDSDSIAKWKSLDIHNLIGKRVLDVGCNTGFFTFQCEMMGASESIGIDSAELAISIANTLKSSVFLSQNTKFKVLSVYDAETLGKFDYILCLSMLHYIPNQDEVIKKLYNMLEDGGVLKLEMGLTDEPEIINGKYYTSIPFLQSLFPVEIEIKPSVNQAGDHIPRYVVTVKK